MLTKTRIVPESSLKVELRIDKNHTMQKFELVLIVGKNEIIIARADYLPEIEGKMRNFQRDSKVMWNEVLLVGETE